MQGNMALSTSGAGNSADIGLSHLRVDLFLKIAKCVKPTFFYLLWFSPNLPETLHKYLQMGIKRFLLSSELRKLRMNKFL